MSVKYFDIDYELDSRITRGLRAIFEKDDRFVYNKNQEETEVIITTQYPENTDTVDKIPHIVIDSSSYDINMQHTFDYNFYQETEHKGFKNGAKQYMYLIPFNTTIKCVGQQSISKDLASKLAWYFSFGATQYISEFLGLQLNGISKGNTVPSTQYPQKIFETTVLIRGTLSHIGTKRPEDMEVLNDIDTPLKDIKIIF